MTNRDPYSSRISGTGSFGNAIFHPQDADIEQELTAAQVKAAYEAALAEDQAAKDKVQNQLDGDAFITAHPEIKDTVANAKLFVHEMDRTFGPGRHPIAHFEAAYESLRASNFLALDQKELAKQQKASAKARYDASYATDKERIVANAFDPNDGYETISLEEIRKRADEEVRHQMQRRGEEGGY